MKTRFFTLLLSLVCLLTPSLAACGSDESASKPDAGSAPASPESIGADTWMSGIFAESESSEETPGQTTFPIAGTWKPVRFTEGAEDACIIISEDGTMTTADGEEVEPSTDLEHIDWDKRVSIKYGHKKILFILIDGHYLLEESTSAYYYREEDFSDYEVVELTADNVADYVEFQYWFQPHQSQKGFVDSIEIFYRIDFKDGLGAPSYIKANLTYTQDRTAVTFDAVTGEETARRTYGEESEELTTNAGDVDRSVVSNFSGIASWYYIERYSNNDGTAPLVEDIYFKRVTGAETIIGKVFVPKGWNA